MPSPRHNDTSKQQRVIFSLPKALVEELQKYAGLVRGGNKSGFVADAKNEALKDRLVTVAVPYNVRAHDEERIYLKLLTRFGEGSLPRRGKRGRLAGARAPGCRRWRWWVPCWGRGSCTPSPARPAPTCSPPRTRSRRRCGTTPACLPQTSRRRPPRSGWG